MVSIIIGWPEMDNSGVAEALGLNMKKNVSIGCSEVAACLKIAGSYIYP